MDKGDWTLLSLWVHVPIVTLWVGLVMLDAFAALAPGLEPEQRARMIAWSRPFTVLAIVVIMITGVWQTIENPLLPGISSYSELEQLRERTYGLALLWKHGFVLATFALTVLVRFFYAPRMLAATAGGGTVAVASTMRTVRLLSLVNLVCCMGALVLATLVVWQLH